MSASIVSVFGMLCVLVANISGSLGDSTCGYFMPTQKPLLCHEIKTIDTRSVIECALEYIRNPYPCVGYIYNKDETLNVHCNMCFVYDVSTPLVMSNVSSSSASMVPEINKERGEIPGGHFYQLEVSLTPAWIRNHMHCKVWDEITFPFPNFNGFTVEVWKWISNMIPHFMMGVTTYAHRD